MDQFRGQGAEATINMMGAMPAVAVRLERRKAEKRLKRPSQLYLGGYPHLRQQTTSPSRANSPSPSPLLSPPRNEEEHHLPEVYVCGKVSALHLAVVSLLLGAVILIVGLVQLKPGADAPGHRYYLIAVGCFLEILGLIITAARCVMLHWKMERRRCSSSRKCEKTAEAGGSHAGGNEAVSLANENNRNMQTEQHMSQSEAAEHKHINLKHLYNSSDVMYIDEMDASTGRRSKSPVESVSTIEVLMGGTKPDAPPTRFADTCSLAMVSPAEFDSLLTQSEQHNSNT